MMLQLCVVDLLDFLCLLRDPRLGKKGKHYLGVEVELLCSRSRHDPTEADHRIRVLTLESRQHGLWCSGKVLEQLYLLGCFGKSRLCGAGMPRGVLALWRR